MHNPLTITRNIQGGGVLWKETSETFKQNPTKISKSPFLVKLQVLKMNSFTCIFQGFCKYFREIC